MSLLPGERREVFLGLAGKDASDVYLRTGMKLTLESAVDGGHQAYREWVDPASELVDQGINAVVIVGGARARRLAWNLCAGFGGAVDTVVVPREDIDLHIRDDDAVTAYLDKTRTVIFDLTAEKS